MELTRIDDQVPMGHGPHLRGSLPDLVARAVGSAP